MRAQTILIGVLAFGIVRPLIVEFASLMGVTGPGSGFTLQQVLLGLLLGAITVPVGVLLLKGKWPRIILCTLLASTYGAVLVLLAVLAHKTTGPVLTGALGLVFFIWCLCGFLASWLTMAVASYIDRNRSRLSTTKT